MEDIHILVVEDDPDINRLLCKILTDGGYQCRAAFSGSEGLLWAERYDYDLVLLDLMLPGLTGEKFISHPGPVRQSRAGGQDQRTQAGGGRLFTQAL